MSEVTHTLVPQSLHPYFATPARKELPLAAVPAFRYRPIVVLSTGARWGIEVESDADGIGPTLQAVTPLVPTLQGTDDPRPIVSANVAPSEVERRGFALEVAGLLQEANVDPTALMLEMSERPRIADLAVAIDEMRQLREMGVRLAVDNFGEGFASLQYLRELPLDVVKIPPSFIAGVCADGEAAHLVSATLSLTSIMGLDAIAMGIETQAQADALQAMDCRLGQGPLFPDIAPSEFAAMTAVVEVPVSIEPVLGWRVWRLDEDGGTFSLASMTRPDRWAPGTPFLGTCEFGKHRDPAPDESCSCGIYAATSPEELARAAVLSSSVAAVGAIAMWGTVVEHARGARSKFAYPSRLRLVCSTCLGAGRGAVDPTVVVGSGSTLLPLCARHAIGKDGPSRPAGEVQSMVLSKYAVDLMPIDRVSTTLRFPRPRPDLLNGLGRVAEGLGLVIGTVLHVLLILWTLAGFLFVAYVILAGIVEHFTGG